MRAVENAWAELATRILNGRGENDPINAASSYCNAAHAAAIAARLAALESCRTALLMQPPDMLALRCHACSVATDSWARRETLSAALQRIGEVEEGATPWLESLPEPAPVDTAENPVVLVFDAVSADVWLCAQKALGENSLPFEWCRLGAEPRTIPALCALFDLDPADNPADVLPERGMDFQSIDGTESAAVTDLVAFDPKRPSVVHIAAFDRAAHAGARMRLCDMPAALAAMIERHVRPLETMCAKQKRPLVVTADHGLSWGKKGLTHGNGGVYERALFLAKNPPEAKA